MDAISCIGIDPIFVEKIIAGTQGGLAMAGVQPVAVGVSNHLQSQRNISVIIGLLGDYTATLYCCHATIGRAVLYTSVTLILGFSILVLSNFLPTIYFGALTGLAILIALLAALTLLPRLILIWKPFPIPE